MSRENEVKVIECNLRASRTFPFISKTFDFNFISLATRVMVGLPAKPGTFHLVDLEYVGVKAPQFSFTRLQGADPTLGVEMVSTGEVACFGGDMYEAFLLALIASGFKLPVRTRAILVSIGSSGKLALLDCVRRLQGLGYGIFATEGTRAFLEGEGGMRGVVELAKPSSGASPNAVDFLREKKLDMVINEPETGDKESATDGYRIRRAAVDFGVPLITNAKCAVMLSLALEKLAHKGGAFFNIRSMEESVCPRARPVGPPPASQCSAFTPFPTFIKPYHLAGTTPTSCPTRRWAARGRAGGGSRQTSLRRAAAAGAGPGPSMGCPCRVRCRPPR
jgi:hypothetical protein